MKKLILTEAQTNELRRAHRAAKNKKDADKIKAIYVMSHHVISHPRFARVMDDVVGNTLNRLSR